jgi:hypothetical protein
MKTPPREPWIAGAAGTFRVCALCSIAASKDVPNGIILQRPLAPAQLVTALPQLQNDRHITAGANM